MKDDPISPDEIHSKLTSAERDKNSPVWDMSQERAFTENLLGQRFNFFLVFFSLVIAGSINAKSQLHFQVVLTIGAIICLLLARVLARTQKKLDLIIDDLITDPCHPIAIIDRRCGPGSVRRTIGFHVPRLCCAVLVIGALLAWSGILKTSALNPPLLSPTQATMQRTATGLDTHPESNATPGQ
jgi:hypothetical protein